ncbi:Tim44 domain-containing protein [Hathewaya histolytica]|uniref:Tim44 domain-containing protein n=1 Tax=Hathewaya histolytica TaxID=1498 RepID=UPI003B684420
MKRLNLFLGTFILIIFISMQGAVVMARAGGGGSSSGGSSSSSSSRRYSSHSSSSTDDFDIKTSIIIPLILFILIALFTDRKEIYYYIRDYKRYLKTKKMLKNLSEVDKVWNYDKLKIRVEKTFYTVQDAWMNRNYKLAKEYMSQTLYSIHKNQVKWLAKQKEKNILENIRVLNISPVKVETFVSSSENTIWFSIKATMADYTIDEKTGMIIDGDCKNTKFVEYWKFIREDYKWVLDEILQRNEFYRNKL